LRNMGHLNSSTHPRMVAISLYEGRVSCEYSKWVSIETQMELVKIRKDRGGPMGQANVMRQRKSSETR
jgi:hypothetical protein